jgi:hypothetical protein
MKNPTLVFALLAIALGIACAHGQPLTQTIRGTVADKVSKSGLPGATVVVLNTDPIVGATTDPDGNFKLSRVPVGTHTLKISFVGYKEIVLPNLAVNSGKEVVLTIPLEEDITVMDEVVITPGIEKNKPINDMATVSTRTFSVEETRKFAAAVNDPARMAQSFAGVVSTNDGSNTISIRGNAPVALLWRMEGVDIPNPNHFANVGTAGGGISILSSQLLTNSDFMTGAFSAEYGNALAGVFDLNLRKGNNEKPEYTVQASFLGTDVAAEGPFAKNYRGSYLINYRYSTLGILSQLGVNVGDAVTNFQDLSYHVYLPTGKAGNFSLFGFGGLSDQNQKAVKDSLKWTDEFQRYDWRYFSNTGANGLKHTVAFGANTYVQSTLLLSGNDGGYEQERLDENYRPQFSFKRNFINNRLTATTVLTHKLNARVSARSGIYFNRYFFTLRQRDLNEETNLIETPLNAEGQATTWQAFTQWSFRASERLTLQSGVHMLYLAMNRTRSIEPRASVKYELSDKEAISLGYGLHSQMQPVGIYQTQVLQPGGLLTQPNRQLGFNKAHHLVLGYDRALTEYLRVKAETYYQHLYNIAVKNDPASPISTLIIEEGYLTDPLVNQGRGRNYGVELTVEQFTHNNFYFLLSTSLYDSKYRALDGIWRNTRFNGKRAMSFTAGKEYGWQKNRTFGVNVRLIYAGGFRTTPIDVEKSRELRETRLIESLAFTEQLPDYFRTDLRVSLKRNLKKSTRTWSLDLQNATNHQNLGGQYFDPIAGEVQKWYQLPLLPVLSYRVEF